MTKVRLVVMQPVVIEKDYDGFVENLDEWARLVVTNEHDKAVASAHPGGPDTGYWSFIVECVPIDRIPPEPTFDMSEILAPGFA